ncbi:hypothetical protein KEM48_012872 [Puccinia striiformis f. sp. tritici PST-130]|nr:hypothetical protein Pst134EB_021596 [Puccinia striiformis f. sp. tritici]KAI9629525.1 hypothetical protein KEM48_012872 [Puccinia striiformis f. sp. tritici PST-130]
MHHTGKNGLTTPLASSSMSKNNSKGSPSQPPTANKRNKGKGKQQTPPPSDSDKSFSESDSEATEAEDLPPAPTLKKQGRPRSDIIKQAAKNMKEK